MLPRPGFQSNDLFCPALLYRIHYFITDRERVTEEKKDGNKPTNRSTTNTTQFLRR